LRLARRRDYQQQHKHDCSSSHTRFPLAESLHDSCRGTEVVMTLAERRLLTVQSNNHQQSSRRCQVIKALIDVFTWGMIAFGLYGLVTTMWSTISKKRRENHL
jgi:hypothetical protein